jgi:hypothetical protein
VADILAIVSKAVFERDARVDGRALQAGDVWPVDRYNSTNKALQPLADGGRIFLVTVRPPNEQLWLVGVVERPTFDGAAWIGAANSTPATNISALRAEIQFESGKGISQDRGTLGMSLQTPRVLAGGDVDIILSAVGAGGAAAKLDTVPAAPPRDRPKAKPRVIDSRYEIVRTLGKGGMGVVHEARHLTTGRKVALKEILTITEKNAVERFQREARATGAIETRHVAPILDAGLDPKTDHPYLVMELLQGDDLAQRLAKFGTLGEDVALRVVAQAATGLKHAHAAGVIHRDIKPANLFLAKRDDELVVTLLDFGVARVRDELRPPDQRTLTATGAMLGTPLYMSPEQVVGSKKLDHRADLWSLGVVLYEALAGVTPYDDAETLGALLVMICREPARPVRELAPHVSEMAETVVTRALAIDPDDRYQTADELLDAIDTLLPYGDRLDDFVL